MPPRPGYRALRGALRVTAVTPASCQRAENPTASAYRAGAMVCVRRGREEMVSFGRLIAAAGFVALAAAPLAAQTALVPEKEKKICRSEASTGSLVARKKICKTKAQWDAERREAQAVTQQMQEPRVSCGSAPQGC